MKGEWEKQGVKKEEGEAEVCGTSCGAGGGCRCEEKGA